MSLDRIGDVLSQQAQQTGALNRYQGNSAAIEQKRNKLKQLIAQMKSILASLPPQIAAMLAGVINEAEALLISGSLDAIGAMIGKLEKIIAILMELLQELTAASGELNLEALIAFLSGMAANLDAAKKAQLAKLIRMLRRAALKGSLHGLDEASWDEEGGMGDGSAPVEPNTDNVVASLQSLLEAIFATRTRVVSASDPQKTNL